MDTREALLQLEQIQGRLTAEGPSALRLSLVTLDPALGRAAMVVGPRGTGKTTLLVKLVRENPKLLYFSADHPLVSRFGILELAEEALRAGYTGLAVDEVHFAPDWSRDLKALYDSHPRAQVYASDSSSIVLRKGAADLSRRFPHHRISLLSFREFVHLKTGKEFPPFDPLATAAQCNTIADEVPVIPLFGEYLREGLRPIFFEGNYPARILGIIEKTIFGDVPFLLPSIQENYLRVMNAVLGYLASASIPTINVESLSSEWSLGKEKLYELLNVLDAVELITIVRHRSDKRASSKGAKLLFADPSFYHVLGGDRGNAREAFLVSMAHQVGRTIHAHKDEREADFILDDTTLEVGGKTKKRKAATFVIRDDIERPSREVLPLWSFGFMY